jgi:hypothetical protein
MLLVQSSIVQSNFSEITANTTTTSTSLVTLKTTTLTTGAGYLNIYATFSTSNATAGSTNNFILNIDGSASNGSSVLATDVADCGVIYKKIAVSAGSHTVILQWSVSAGTGMVRPVNTIAEHASLLIVETLV